MERIEIYTSKKKSLLMLIGSIAFVALGTWMLFEADSLTGWRGRSPLVTRAIGVASILFFGAGIVIGIKRLLKSEIAIVIDRDGLHAGSSKSLGKFIPWDGISGFDEIKIYSTRILIIRVKNSTYWLENEDNQIRKKLMQFNIANYGSPFSIASAGLEISHDELVSKLNLYFERYSNVAKM
jgi:hypothetical protein